MSDRMQVQMAALAVGMSARVDQEAVGLRGRERQLTGHMVDDMRALAEELLPKGDALRTAILTFATHYEQDRRDVEAMRAHGAVLQAAVEADLGPSPPRPADPPAQVREVVPAQAARLPVATPPPQVFGGAEHHPWMDRRDIND